MGSKIYTRVGDKGDTSLLSGTKVRKNHLRLELYGSIDELNSWLGLILTHLNRKESLKQEKEFLEKIQASLFDLGSLLACEKEKRNHFQLQSLTLDLVFEMERRIDKIEETVGVLKNFILPGGSELASLVHLARTFCRRIERGMVHFDEELPGELPEHALIFLNRFSDYLFTLARIANKVEGHEEIIWKR